MIDKRSEARPNIAFAFYVLEIMTAVWRKECSER